MKERQRNVEDYIKRSNISNQKVIKNKFKD